MVQQAGVKREDIVPSHQEPWWCGLVLEKADGHHKQLGITHLYSSYSWANGLTSFQLLQPSTKIQCDLLPSPSKVIFWSEWQGKSVFPEKNPNPCCFVLYTYIYMQAHVHTPHVLTCSKDWIKSHGWQPGVAALQRQAKPSCIKPEHRAPWAWPVKCYHTHATDFWGVMIRKETNL